MDGALSLQWLFSRHKRLIVSFNVSRNSLHLSKQKRKLQTSSLTLAGLKTKILERRSRQSDEMRM